MVMLGGAFKAFIYCYVDLPFLARLLSLGFDSQVWQELLLGSFHKFLSNSPECESWQYHCTSYTLL